MTASKILKRDGVGRIALKTFRARKGEFGFCGILKTSYHPQRTATLKAIMCKSAYSPVGVVKCLQPIEVYSRVDNLHTMACIVK